MNNDANPAVVELRDADKIIFRFGKIGIEFVGTIGTHPQPLS